MWGTEVLVWLSDQLLQVSGADKVPNLKILSLEIGRLEHCLEFWQIVEEFQDRCSTPWPYLENV